MPHYYYNLRLFKLKAFFHKNASPSYARKGTGRTARIYWVLQSLAYPSAWFEKIFSTICVSYLPSARLATLVR